MRKLTNAVIAVALSAMIFGIASPVIAAIDKWGGDDRVKNPSSQYQTGTATASDSYTLTDGSKSWKTNSLAGLILQPNVNSEVYYLIKSNTGTIITVYGNDTVGNEEECHRHISADNDGSQPYAILDRWSVQKVNSRWWLFDPHGNAFFAKSVNDFGVMDVRFGNAIDGTNHTTLINSQPYGGSGTNAGGYTGNLFKGVVDTVKSSGFNTLGATIDASYSVPGSCYNPYGGSKTPNRYFPFISQVRISNLKTVNTNKFTVNGATIADALDTDFQTDLVSDILTGNAGTSAATEGYRLFDKSNCTGRSGWQSWFLTPYAKAKYNIPANPYFIGYDWDEEPAYLRSQAANEHMGYRILTSAAGTSRKEEAMAVLQAAYVSIGALNTAWGTAYADWAALDADTGTGGINAVLSNEPYCRYWLETNKAMLADLDKIAEDFWRTYTKKVHDALDTLTAAHVLNYGPGYHGWMGDSARSFQGTTSPEYLFRGSVSADATVPYIDVIEIGDPLHGPHQSMTPDFYEYMGNDLKERYAFHGRPYHHESVWLTAEADSAVAYSGKLSGLAANVLTDANAHFDGNGVNYPSYSYGTNAPRRMVLIDPDNHPQGSRQFFSVCLGQTETNCVANSISDTTIGVRYQISDSDWVWHDGTAQMTATGAIGLPYVFVAHDAFGQLGNGSYPLYIPLTQADRGAMYAKFVNDAAGFKADNGDSIVVGFSQWSWFDFSFKSNGTETRNFGFMTVRGNLYDGSANTANGEIHDCGDFVTPAKVALTSLYDNIVSGLSNNSSTSPSASFTAPASGATLSGTVGIAVTHSDSVAKVEYYAGSTLIGTSTVAPYGLSWNTAALANGAYTLTAKPYDANNIAGQSASEPITIKNTVPDTAIPTITAFTIPSTATSLTVAITTFTASDNVGVAGYLVTESSSSPLATASGWTSSAPTSFTFSSAGSKTAYAWAKDAAGNVSYGLGKTVAITLPDATAPYVTVFSVPSTSTNQNIPVTAFSAYDNVAVTGYLITESYRQPSKNDSGWTSAVPTTYVAASSGAHTLYPWVKDAAGNISKLFSSPLTVYVTQFDTASSSTSVNKRIGKLRLGTSNTLYTGTTSTTLSTSSSTKTATSKSTGRNANR